MSFESIPQPVVAEGGSDAAKDLAIVTELEALAKGNEPLDELHAKALRMESVRGRLVNGGYQTFLMNQKHLGEFKDDPDVMLQAIRFMGGIRPDDITLPNLSDRLKNDKSFWVKVAEVNPYAILASPFNQDEELWTIAFRKEPMLLVDKNVPENIRGNLKIAREAYTKDKSLLNPDMYELPPSILNIIQNIIQKDKKV